MRILLLSKNFPPRTCGVGDYACRFREYLAATGNEVVVFTEPVTGAREAPIAIREVSLGGWRDYRPLLAAIEQAAPDCLQLEYAGYAWNRWGAPWWLNALLFALRRRKISVHLGLHEIAIRMRQHPLQVPVALAQWLHIGLLMAAAETTAVNMPSRVVLLSHVFPWWRGRLRYRPNSSNIPVVPLAASERSGLRRERGLGSGEAVVATFGMFHRVKNYEAIIEAVRLLGRSHPVKLWMLGDVAMAAPDYRAQLEDRARAAGIDGEIWWSGKLEAAEISRYLQAADVFVLPQADGHLTRSGAFMAAAAHGLPVVAVRDPTGRDQQEFTHGENVWLVERSAPEPIAEGLRSLVGDPTVAGLIGRNLLRLYQARFDWPRTVGTPGSENPQGAARHGGRPYEGPERAAAVSAGGAKP